jgi:hypothetical protein
LPLVLRLALALPRAWLPAYMRLAVKLGAKAPVLVGAPAESAAAPSPSSPG